jgi:hypothetical protein
MSFSSHENGVVVQSIVEDYFDSSANDSDKSWTVPDGEQWEFLHAHVILVSSATAGNRLLALSITDASGNLRMDVVAGAVQAESLTRHYALMKGIYRETSFVNDEIQMPIPESLFIHAGGVIRVYDSAAIDPTADDMTVAFSIRKV